MATLLFVWIRVRLCVTPASNSTFRWCPSAPCEQLRRCTAISGLLICVSKLWARFLVWHKNPFVLCTFLGGEHHPHKSVILTPSFTFSKLRRGFSCAPCIYLAICAFRTTDDRLPTTDDRQPTFSYNSYNTYNSHNSHKTPNASPWRWDNKTTSARGGSRLFCLYPIGLLLERLERCPTCVAFGGVLD